jgi:ATPase
MLIMEKYDKLVPDTSVIIDGVLSGKIENKEIKVNELIIPEAVMAELENQANQNKSIGFYGLDEIKKLRNLVDSMRFAGEKPKFFDIREARLGIIDALIRQIAYEEDAVLMTSDKVQARVAEAKGIKLLHIKKEEKEVKIKLESFFDEMTMSVHLRDNVIPSAKKGRPGSWDFAELSKKPITKEEIQDIAREIVEEAEKRRDGFVEIERPGSTIVQLGLYRIVICRPPFADGWEITAVRPVKQLNLDDYKMSEKLTNRVAEQAEGILVAGAPGMGKSTFAQALCIYYASKHKIVKTVEAPRDLILPDNITQYAISHGDAQEIHDILLLSRPDYTIFDEMRNTDDFKLFADMRLAGVGMVGVVHATNPIDAIQRFLGRIEMGVIPQIIDTVVFIKNGEIKKVLSLNMTVKVPSGMMEADLARPVVEVHDFETDKLAYEIYSYGEQTVVVPVSQAVKQKQGGIQKLASDRIRKEFMKYSRAADVEILSEGSVRVKVPKHDIPAIIGKQGRNITELEGKLGVHIDVEEMGSEPKRETEGEQIDYRYDIEKKSIIFYVGEQYINKDVDIYVNDEFLMAVKVGNKGNIKVNKQSQVGKFLADALNEKAEVRLLI